MVLLETFEEWQHQSSLLLQARPTTARITTKYNVPDLKSPKYQKQKRPKNESGDKEATAASRIPRAVLELKAYDPESGACLKFKTDKAADVGRLVGGLGRLGRHMAALPPKTEDTVMEDAVTNTEKAGQEPISTTEAPSANIDGKPQQTGGGKKKKKGKK